MRHSLWVGYRDLESIGSIGDRWLLLKEIGWYPFLSLKIGPLLLELKLVMSDIEKSINKIAIGNEKEEKRKEKKSRLDVGLV